MPLTVALTTLPEAYFLVGGEPGVEMVVRLTDLEDIRHANGLLAGTIGDNLHVGGRVVASPVFWNQPWGFHLDPESVFFFDLSAELGDASITYVQNHLGEVGGAFLPNGIWTPWSSRLIGAIQVHEGSERSDALDGGPGRDLLWGAGGRDFLQGGPGIDRVYGGDDDDRLEGGPAADLLDGGPGDDRLDGGAGSDTVSYAARADGVTATLGAIGRATGGAGTDTLVGIENVIGSRGDDTLTGDGQANRLDGEAGADTLAGGVGTDTLIGGAGNDWMTGGQGRDTFVVINPEQAETDTITDFAVGPSGDVLDLSAVAFGQSFEEFRTGSVSMAGRDTVIDVSENLRIVLQNVAASRLTSANLRLSPLEADRGPFGGTLAGGLFW